MGTHSYIFVCSLETDYLVFNFEFGQLMTFFIIYETQLQLSNFTPNIETFNLCTQYAFAAACCDSACTSKLMLYT